MTFIKFNEIRKCLSLKQLMQFDLFPLPEFIIQIERKYSDSLSFEDIYGYENVNTKKIIKEEKKEDLSSSLKKTNFEPTI